MAAGLGEMALEGEYSSWDSYPRSRRPAL